MSGGRVVSVSSMTGFAHAEGEADGISWIWEVKSVNGRSLELRLRLTQIGFVVLLGIMILATSNDILRWLGHVFRR